MIENECAGQADPMRDLIAAAAPRGKGATWRDDLRLFLIAWGLGFVFFLILIG